MSCDFFCVCVCVKTGLISRLIVFSLSQEWQQPMRKIKTSKGKYFAKPVTAGTESSRKTECKRWMILFLGGYMEKMERCLSPCSNRLWGERKTHATGNDFFPLKRIFNFRFMLSEYAARDSFSNKIHAEVEAFLEVCGS